VGAAAGRPDPVPPLVMDPVLVVGLVLLAAAALIWWSDRRRR
jgi:hypothetical protein